MGLSGWVLSATAFLVSTLYVPGVPSNTTVGRWWVMALGAALLLWARRPQSVVTPAHWMGLVLIAWCLLSAQFWAASGFDAVGGAITFLIAASVFCAGAKFEREEVERAWWWFSLGVTISAVFAVAQHLGHQVAWTVPGHSAGLLLSKNMATEAAVLALVGAVALRAWWLAPGPLVLIALGGLAGGGTMANAREGVFALLVAGLAVVWFKRPQWRPYVVLFVGSAILILAFAYQHGAMPTTWRHADRFEIWSNVFLSTSLQGDGLGSVAIFFRGYEFAHNEYLHFAFELGVGSFLIWGIGAYALCGEWLAAKVALVALAAMAFVYFPFHAPAPVFLGALLAGCLARERHLARVSQLAGRIPGRDGVRHSSEVAAAIRPRAT